MNAIEKQMGKRQLMEALKLGNAVRGFNCSYLACVDCPFHGKECLMVLADDAIKYYFERQVELAEGKK